MGDPRVMPVFVAEGESAAGPAEGAGLRAGRGAVTDSGVVDGDIWGLPRGLLWREELIIAFEGAACGEMVDNSCPVAVS